MESTPTGVFTKITGDPSPVVGIAVSPVATGHGAPTVEQPTPVPGESAPKHAADSGELPWRTIHPQSDSDAPTGAGSGGGSAGAGSGGGSDASGEAGSEDGEDDSGDSSAKPKVGNIYWGLAHTTNPDGLPACLVPDTYTVGRTVFTKVHCWTTKGPTGVRFLVVYVFVFPEGDKHPDIVYVEFTMTDGTSTNVQEVVPPRPMTSHDFDLCFGLAVAQEDIKTVVQKFLSGPLSGGHEVLIPAPGTYASDHLGFYLPVGSNKVLMNAQDAVRSLLAQFSYLAVSVTNRRHAAVSWTVGPHCCVFLPEGPLNLRDCVIKNKHVCSTCRSGADTKVCSSASHVQAGWNPEGHVKMVTHFEENGLLFKILPNGATDTEGHLPFYQRKTIPEAVVVRFMVWSILRQLDEMCPPFFLIRNIFPIPTVTN